MILGLEAKTREPFSPRPGERAVDDVAEVLYFIGIVKPPSLFLSTIQVQTNWPLAHPKFSVNSLKCN